MEGELPDDLAGEDTPPPTAEIPEDHPLLELFGDSVRTRLLTAIYGAAVPLSDRHIAIRAGVELSDWEGEKEALLETGLDEAVGTVGSTTLYDIPGEDPRLEAGQVPNLFIFTRGRGRARFGDREMEVHEGMSVFVGPYVKHVISNPYDEPLEGILVLFGDNGDFVGGTSYLDLSEDLYEFYGEHPAADIPRR